jgi:DNA gyrase/topoisomerase IV subunit B
VEPITFTEVAHALLRNALREAAEGHCTTITVEVSDDAVRVTDDGRGLPVHPHPRSGRPLAEVILTGPRRGPVNTLARVNTHSLWLEVEVHRDGEVWGQRYEFATPLRTLEKRGPSTRRGTTIACAPAVGDPPAFDALRTFLREATVREGGPIKVKVRLRDLREARDETIVIA